MTNTENRSGIELNEFPACDDAETLDRLALQLTAADTRSLAIYGLDSDNQTLVGIGPIERARRSREAAEKSDSERMPQSEPPGPFIAAEDEALPALLRSRTLGRWVIALPALLLAVAAALVLVRGHAPAKPPAASPPAAKLARPSVPPRPPAADAIQPPPVESRAAASLDAVEEHGELRPPAVPSQSARAPAQAPIPIAALPVKLAELSSPVLVDRSSDTDMNVGAINVTSNPPASVVLDGRPLGKAPLVVRVPAGVHSLLFIHPLYGRRSLSVSVSPGLTRGASVEF
jgi:hypothetical protein